MQYILPSSDVHVCIYKSQCVMCAHVLSIKTGKAERKKPKKKAGVIRGSSKEHKAE